MNRKNYITIFDQWSYMTMFDRRVVVFVVLSGIVQIGSLMYEKSLKAGGSGKLSLNRLTSDAEAKSCFRF